ncbi:beta-N-acetylhexosaminidase [Gillisia sp. M10.2A]|uniref:beta-N-acetylhexosaminidase n=1 Tax=Gillisia lutea TaxID=2909668 RepID=A0ABS9ECL8_9FLAO|nr:beta-N-acetylhexosaminidase [Gillisia lutea]MCF4100617.1 beta-N-acetylhexosaminidase [Gillisia lutea]
MKHTFYNIVILSFLTLVGCSGYKRATSGAKQTDTSINIIPKPANLNVTGGMYKLPRKNSICYNSEAASSAPWLQQILEAAQLHSEIKNVTGCGNWNLSVDKELMSQLGEEGYILDITSKGVNIKSAGTAGLFYGIQSIRQLLPSEIESEQLISGRIALPQLHIEDAPKYSWRGSMIDVARSFFGKEYILKHIDRMALYKLNRLHLHLTDDQGWRIELKSKPRLSEIGGKSSVVNAQSGFITQQEYIEIQEYALARNIVVIPEIDMPGHIYTALVAYPELNCEDLTNINTEVATPPQLYSKYKVGWSKLCLDKPEVYEFVSEILGELATLTKGPWLHIGGDEIKDPLYEEFIKKAEAIVNQNGKIAIGWEEATKADISNSFIGQRWNGKTTSKTSIKVIESICSSFYFDHGNVTGQPNTNNWCKKTGVSLEEVYSFISEDTNVLGFEAPVWTELVTTEAMLDNRFWPRTIAVAEISWSDTKRDFLEFTKRLKTHEARLKAMGINYFASPELEWKENDEISSK